ncbi:MAG: fibronectin type III domain-containing protein [Mobilitalea sp.]
MKKTVIFIALLLTIILLSPGTIAKAGDNLLVNGNAESEMSGWTDTQGCWYPTAEITPIEGSYFFWPSKADYSTTYIYQDVDISDYAEDSWVELSGWLANYDQTPHDESVLQLEFLDDNDVVLVAFSRAQRNPQWSKHAIQAQIPEYAVTARIKLIANRYIGSDNDAYFDDLSFQVLSGVYKTIYITGKTAKAQNGETLQLKADNGITTDPTNYLWTSSYDAIASVDANGLVTFYGDASSEVSIYAEDGDTGMSGIYHINSAISNETPAPSVVSGLKLSKATTNTVVLQWTAVENAKGYYIYQYNTSKKKWIKINTITKAATSKATIKKLKKGSSYKFKVVAYSKYGKNYYTGNSSKTLTAKTKK